MIGMRELTKPSVDNLSGHNNRVVRPRIVMGARHTGSESIEQLLLLGSVFFLRDQSLYYVNRLVQEPAEIIHERRPPQREAMSIEEATVSNMWEMAAIVEVLERKGLCTKQDLYGIITESRRLLPVKTRSMWTTVLSDDGDRERRLSFQLYSARVSAFRS